MPEAPSLLGMLKVHQPCFGEGTLKSIATDTGYYSHDNYQAFDKLGLEEIGLQRPNRTLCAPAETLDGEIRTKLDCPR